MSETTYSVMQKLERKFRETQSFTPLPQSLPDAFEGMSKNRFSPHAGLLMTAVVMWIGLVVGDVFANEYHIPSVVHAAIGGVIGYFFTLLYDEKTQKLV